MSAAANVLKRAVAVCALVAFGLIASDTPAFARYRQCSMVEISHVSDYNILACNNTGNEIYCDAETGAARCCGRSGNSLACGEIISTRVTTQPPGPKPPRVKIDVPVVDVSPPKSPRSPRIDPPPSSVAPSKSPAGPTVK